MPTTKTKSYTLDEMKDKFIGQRGSPVREKYEYELRMDLLGQMIKTTGVIVTVVIRKEKFLQ